jgi:3-hydroxyacyl-CoA dehydrogenase
MSRKIKTVEWTLIDTDQTLSEWEPIKAKSKLYLANDGATVTDLGEGVGLIEFHTKANALNDDICDMVIETCEQGGRRFGALVVGNTGKHFSAGANLGMILELATNKRWDWLERTIRNLQKATMSLKGCRVPVVAAPFSNALGGGCEICLHSALVIAGKDTHMGLVEAGVGLVPAGGGTKELALRAFDKGVSQGGEPLDRLETVLHQILTARVSKDGEEARSLFLTPMDGVARSPGPPLGIARRAALSLMSGDYLVEEPRTDVPVMGLPGLRHLRENIDSARDRNALSAHDAIVAAQVARILCGGDGPPGTAGEQHFLDLERESFLYLAGTETTQQRIQDLLTHKA